MKRRMKRYLILLLAIFILSGCQGAPNRGAYFEKSELLKEEILTESIKNELGQSPAGSAGHVVFISICDTKERAHVINGSGSTIEDAWETANKAAEKYVKRENLEPVWVKADVVYISEKVTAEELNQAVLASRSEFLRYGVAFDDYYGTALLEAEMNGAKIYEYEEGGIDIEYLNIYLKKAGREEMKKLPEEYTVFQCLGWICDENKEVSSLYSGGLEYGRRQMNGVNKDYAEELIGTSMDFLRKQLKEDGSFVYGMYPRFDNEIENYNIVRHAAAIWSMVCNYRMTGDEALIEEIERAIDFLLENIRYYDEDTAYLYEEKDDEIKLGGCGLAVISMTEFMEATGSNAYADVCQKLGNGILTMMDKENGTYYHVLNGDFTEKEEFRTVYYDGEATFGLCQLYELTGDEKWLNAAKSAVENFIANDYWQYKDHWIAYSMNAITEHVNDPRYYTFALQNAQRNLDEIYHRDTTYHTYLELLMATFELYDRMIENNIPSDYLEKFDTDYFLKTIYARAERQLDGYFYSEYAMYMANPQKVLGTFMVRHDGYRIRIDDVQHNVGGYYLYWKNYDKLIEYGMID